MTVRNLSPATQQSYLNAVSKFSRYFGRSPDRLGLEDIHAFQVHLVATGISWPALNQIVCALRFFYGMTLGQAIVPERIAHAREPSKLPVVLGTALPINLSHRKYQRFQLWRLTQSWRTALEHRQCARTNRLPLAAAKLAPTSTASEPLPLSP